MRPLARPLIYYAPLAEYARATEVVSGGQRSATAGLPSRANPERSGRTNGGSSLARASGSLHLEFGSDASVSSASSWIDPAWPLSAAERAEGNRLRDELRRTAWLAGRLIAKSLIAEIVAAEADARGQELEIPRAEVEIFSRGTRGQSIRPRVFVLGRPWVGSLSISHTERGVLVAASGGAGWSVGVDLVEPARLEESFLETWFTPDERQRLCRLPGPEAAIHWGAKEAVYKACQTGESFAPRRIEIERRASARLTARWGGERLVHCRLTTWECDGHVAVLALRRERVERIARNQTDLHAGAAGSTAARSGR